MTALTAAQRERLRAQGYSEKKLLQVDEVLTGRPAKSTTGWTLLDQLLLPPDLPVVELKGLLLRPRRDELPTPEELDLIARTAEQLGPVLAGLLKEKKP